MLGAGDPERVAELMRETAAAALMPRFRNLAKEDIRHKRPGDIVTVADVASEQRLASGLVRILPGVPVVGEEAVENDSGLLDLIGRPAESCWIVDPLDGTSNFAAGRDRFAMIVCLVHDRKTIAGWILDVPNQRMAVAVKGRGVTLNGQPVRLEAKSPPSGYIGFKVLKEFDRQLAPAQRQRLADIAQLCGAGICRRPGGPSRFHPLSAYQAVGPRGGRSDGERSGRARRALRRHALWAGRQHGGRHHHRRVVRGAGGGEGDSRGCPDAAAGAAPLGLALGFLPEGLHLLEAGVGRLATLLA
jgi:fructose-1,6-bisphosphatase/inositol monophosphatase family enzyme